MRGRPGASGRAAVQPVPSHRVPDSAAAATAGPLGRLPAQEHAGQQQQPAGAWLARPQARHVPPPAPAAAARWSRAAPRLGDAVPRWSRLRRWAGQPALTPRLAAHESESARSAQQGRQLQRAAPAGRHLPPVGQERGQVLPPGQPQLLAAATPQQSGRPCALRPRSSLAQRMAARAQRSAQVEGNPVERAPREMKMCQTAPRNWSPRSTGLPKPERAATGAGGRVSEGDSPLTS